MDRMINAQRRRDPKEPRPKKAKFDRTAQTTLDEWLARVADN